MSSNHKITHKIVIKAKIETKSPLLIGKGGGNYFDLEVIKLPDGRPYIPASSLAGKLRSLFPVRKADRVFTDNYKYLWGSEADDTDLIAQSHLVIDDLLPPKDKDNTGEISEGKRDKITFRDGVRINAKTNIAQDKGKYDYEIVEPGIIFPLNMEITVREGMNAALMKSFARFLLDCMADDDNFRIGSHASAGFGCVEISEQNIFLFDFAKDGQAKNWINYLDNKDAPLNIAGTINSWLKPSSNQFKIEAWFKIKSSFIIGSYSEATDASDKTSLKSGKDFVVSGKSLRGAIRHRALKILNTAGIEQAEEKLKSLMGYEGNRKEKLTAIKSRLRIEEAKIEDVEEKLQDRIKIDRFTGGTIDGAKFDSQPVWSQSDKANIRLLLYIDDYKPWEAALMLHVLKDLWTGDLAVGGEKNVGRGVLQGINASISFPKKYGANEGVETVVLDFEKSAGYAIQKLQQFNKPLTELLKL